MIAVQENKIVFLLISASLLLVPLFLFLAWQENLIPLISLGIFIGLAVLFWFYRKWPFTLLFIILPAIIVGPVISLTVRDYSYEISLAEILILAACLIFMIDKSGRAKIDFKMSQVGWAFLAFIFLSGISLLWADNISRGLIAVRVLLYHFLVFFLVINIIKTKNDFLRALWALPVTAFFVSLQLFFKLLKLGGWNTIFIPERTQLITPVGSWVFVSAIIVLCIPLSYSLLVTLANKRGQGKIIKASLFSPGWVVKPEKMSFKDWWRYPTLFLMIVFSVLSSLFTLGKGEILSLAAGLAYFFKKQKAKKWLTALVVVFVLILLAIFFAQYGSQFGQRIINTFSDRNTRFRVEEFKTGLRVFASNPLVGVGAGNLKLVYRQALPWFVETESNNIIIQILAELGLAGIILAGFLVKTVVDVFRDFRISPPCLRRERILLLGFQSTMVVAIVNSMFEVTFIGLNYGIIFWYIMGLLVGWHRLKHRAVNKL